MFVRIVITFPNMVRFLIFIFSVSLLSQGLKAADSSEQFLTAYQNYQQGEKLERAGNNAEAVKKYRFAESLLNEVAKNDPSWQKPVVDYRLKKTRESLKRLQEIPDGNTVATSGDEVAPEAVSVARTGPSITIVPPGSNSPSAARPSPEAAGEVKRLRNQIDDLKSQLKQSRDALNAQVTRSSELANAEWVKKRSELVNDLDVAKRRISDLERDLKARSSWEKDLKDLQKKLDDAVADKASAEEQFNERARKASQENAELSSQLAEAQKKVAENAGSKQKIEDLTRAVETGKESLEQLRLKLEHSESLAKETTAKNEDLLKQLKKNSDQLTVSQKLADQLAPLKEKLKDLQAQTDRADATKRDSLADVQVLEEERNTIAVKAAQYAEAAKDASRVKGLEAESAELKKSLAQLQENLTASDANLAKVREESQKKNESSDNLTKLLQQQNESLQQQLNASLARITEMVDHGQDAAALKEQSKKLQEQVELNAKNYESTKQQLEELSKSRPNQEKELQEKVKALADAWVESEKLQGDLASANKKIAMLQKQGGTGDDRLKDLQDQLASKDKEIARLKKRKGASSPAEEQTTEENTLLRGIVLRQIKEEAKRAQAKRLMQEELKHLNVESQTLTEQIAVLSSPSIELTPQERALFKDAQLVVSEGSENKLEASISAPISRDPSTNSQSQMQAGSESKNDKGDGSGGEMAWQGKFKELLSRAKEEFERQDYLQAENTFQEGLKLSPDDYFALANLGVVQFQLGKMNEAEVTLKKASQKSNDSSFALTTLGIVNYRQQKLDDAEKVLRKAVSINDQDFTAHNYLGIVLAASGRGKAGESEIMKSIEINPQYADAHFNLAVIYATGKPPAKMMAKKHYNEAIRLGSPPDPSLEHLIQ